MAAASSEPDPATPSPGAGRTASTTPPKFSHRLQDALHHNGRLADLGGRLDAPPGRPHARRLPPGGFDGDFPHMAPEQLKALAQLMRGDGGPLAPGQARRYTFDSLPVDGTPRPA
jgi:hypothetical protein